MKNRELLKAKAEAKIELLRRAAKKGNFWSYCLYMDRDFFMKRNVLKGVADVLQHVYEAHKIGESIHVGISMAPRAGKSYIVSLFSSFMIGHFPKESIMRNTCTKTLYNKLSKDTRNLVDSEKWKSIFKFELETRGINTWGLAEAIQGSYFGGGTGGTIIGFGANLDITDDLYKGWTDAMSDTVNNSTTAWSDATRGTRAEKGCCHIDVGTRWRKNDIIGRSVERGDYDYDICIPALNKEGKSFCEDVNTTKFYLKKKETIAPEIWESEYMQAPIDIKGRLFAPDELIYYSEDEFPEREVEANLAVCDTADTGIDNLSMPFAKKVGNKYYLYDWVFTGVAMDVTGPLIKGEIQVNGVEKVRFESNNGGKLFARDIFRDVDAEITWKATTSNKETRVLMDAAWIKKHIVFRKEIGHGDYYRAFQQMITYVKQVKRQPDDAVDSLSMFRRFTDDLGLNLKNKTGADREEWGSDSIESWQIN